MPKPLLHDFMRALRSKSVIIITFLPILISLAIIPLISAVTVTVSSSNQNTSALLYYDIKGYHFLVYSANQYGQPIGGVIAKFNLTDSTHNYRSSGTTNSSCYSFININAPKSTAYLVSGQTILPNGGVGEEFRDVQLHPASVLPGLPQNLSSGQILNLFSQSISAVVDNSNGSKRDIQAFFAGTNGQSQTFPFTTRPTIFPIPTASRPLL